MQFGMDSLNNISQKIIDRELKYADTIILGDNSSGKSLLLRMLVEKAGNTDSVYFIDAVNRGFDVTKVSNDIRESEYKRTIINTRIQEEYFNIKDSFNCYGTVTERRDFKTEVVLRRLLNLKCNINVLKNTDVVKQMKKKI